MDNENKFWLFVWGIIATVFSVLIVCFTVSNFDRRAKWEDAVKNGADPMVASCALYDQTGAEAVTCALLAVKK